MSQKQVPLQYKQNWELRADIVDAVTDHPAVNYYPDRSGIVKEDLVCVADALDIDPPDDETLSDMTLVGLYNRISEAVGLEAPNTAGNQWALNREHLKRIHREVA